MKRILTCILLILFCATHNSIAQFVRGVYNNERINGNIISVTDIICFKKLNGAVDSNISVIKYNIKGEATEQLVTKSDDKRFPKPAVPVNSKVYEHDWKVVFEYHYDKDRRLSKVTFTRDKNNGLFKYNKKAEPIEMITYNPDGSLVEKNLSTYNSQGRLIKTKIIYNKGATLIQKYKYDKANRLSMETFYNDNVDKSKIYLKYESFDALGNWTKYISLNDKIKK